MDGPGFDGRYGVKQARRLEITNAGVLPRQGAARLQIDASVSGYGSNEIALRLEVNLTGDGHNEDETRRDPGLELDTTQSNYGSRPRDIRLGGGVEGTCDENCPPVKTYVGTIIKREITDDIYRPRQISSPRHRAVPVRRI